jgi:RNA polymerase sigma factor (sigma-70 family)
MNTAERNRLTLEVMPLIRSVARRYTPPGTTLFYDLVQAGVVSVLVHADSFDPERGEWQAFAWQWARAGMTRLIRLVRPNSNCSKARCAEMAAESIEDVVLTSSMLGSDELVIAKELTELAQKALVENRLGRKPKRLLFVVSQIAAGHNESEVGRQLGVSRERVRQLKVKALDRVRSIMA